MNSNSLDSGTPSAATLQCELTEMKQRLVRAEGERDAWRAAGMQEKHLEACSLVDALGLQLARISEGLLQARARDSKSARDASTDVTYDGSQYAYGAYRYDRLEDALVYAQIARGRGEAPDFSAVSAPAEPLPGSAELAVMAALGITLDERNGYRCGSYRYERLVDAVAYATRRPPLAGNAA